MASVAVRKYVNVGAYGAYALLALLILGPLLRTGYVLVLDLVFTPHLRMPATISSSYVLHVLFHVLNYGLPSQLIEKVMLFTILLLAGIGGYRLVLGLENTYDKYLYIGAFMAGMFYMINPFTYDRFMTGQYNVVFGYALLPWFLKTLLQFIEHPTWKVTVAVAIWAIVISIVSIHAIGFLILLTAIALGIGIFQRRHDRTWRNSILKLGLLVVAIFIAASSYWLVPLVRGNSTTAIALHTYGANDQSAFATVGDTWLSKAMHLIQLQGFWAEPRDLYALPQAHVGVWGIISVVMLLLVIGGGVSYWRQGKHEVAALFIASGAAAFILAIGTLNSWLSAHIPLFAGYREPEKFVALIALAYAVFIARGCAVVLRYWHEQGGLVFLAVAILLILLLPVVWTPTMWWGFNNQLIAAEYPQDWFAVNHRLDADHSNFQTLFLPWHLYMYFSFAGRIIANPAPNFFDKPVLVSDNPEFKGISPSSTSPTKQQLDQTLPHASSNTNLGEQLARLNIKYIVLAKDDDYANYRYLDQQRGLKLVSETATLKMYRNEAWREK